MRRHDEAVSWWLIMEWQRWGRERISADKEIGDHMRRPTRAGLRARRRAKEQLDALADALLIT